MKNRERFGNLCAYIVLGLLSLSMIVPFVWMIIGSLRSTTEFFLPLEQLLPSGAHWVNYLQAWKTVPFASFFLNSLIVAVVVTMAQLVTSTFAAYAFSRLNFRGRDALFIAYLATMMVPAQVTMIPLFILMVKLQWIDSFAALIVPFAASAYGCFCQGSFSLPIRRDWKRARPLTGGGN